MGVLVGVYLSGYVWSCLLECLSGYYLERVWSGWEFATVWTLKAFPDEEYNFQRRVA